MALCAVSACIPKSDPLDNCAKGCCGGQCVDNQCQPVELAGLTMSGNLPVLAQYEDSIIYCDGPNIDSIPKAGGKPRVLATFPPGHVCEALAIDPARGVVYQASTSVPADVGAIPVDGGPFEEVSPQSVSALAIAPSGTLYWSVPPPNASVISSYDPDTKTTSSLVTMLGVTVTAMAVAPGDRLLWADGGGGGDVWISSIEGAMPTRLMNGVTKSDPFDTSMDPHLIVTDDEWAYFGENHKLFRAPLDGQSPAEVLANGGRPVGVAVDADAVYWADYAANTIETYRFVTGEIEVLDAYAAQPYGLVADDECLYWADVATDRLMKIAKPASPR